MKWLWLLMSKTLSRRRALTCIITVALAFILALFISGAHAMDGFERTYNQRLTNIYGYYHAVFYNIYADKENIHDKTIDKVGFFEIYGKKPANSALSDIVIGYADTNAIDLHKITLVKGRMPSGPGEAVVEEWMTKDESLNAQIGNTLEITYSAPDKEGAFTDNVAVSVTVVGIVKDYSSLHTDNLYIEYDKAILPSIITGGALNQNKITTCSVYLNTVQNYDKTLSELNSNLIYAGRYEKNINRYDDSELSQTNELVKSTTKSIFVLVLIFGSLLMLLLQFLYTYSQNRNLNISKSLGITFGQKALFIIALNISVTILALIPGIVLGTGLAALFSVLLTNVFEIEVVKLLSLQSVLYSTVLFVGVGIVVSLICVIIEHRMSKSKQKSKKPAYMPKTHSPYKLFSHKTILYSPAKFTFVSLAIALCMSLMCFSSVYKGQYGNLSNTADNIYDYFIYTQIAQSTDELNIPLAYGDAGEITDQKLMALCKNTAVENYVRGFLTQINILTDKNSESDSFFGKYLDSVPKGTAYGYSSNNLYKTGIKCMDAKDFALLENCKIYGNIDIEAIDSGRDVIITFSESALESGLYDDKKIYAEALKTMVGKNLTLTQVSRLENTDDLSSGKRHDFNVKLGAVVIIPPTEKKALTIFPKFGNLSGSYSSFYQGGLFFNRFECNIRLASAEYANIFEKAIKSNIGNYENVKTESANQSRISLQQTFLMLDSVIGGITIVLCSFALIFILINYGQNIIVKKRVYQQLYIIGATPKQINIIMLSEYISYIIFAAIFAAIPVSVLLYALYTYDNSLNSVVSIVTKSFLIPIIISALLCLPLYMFNKKWIANTIKE